jgi:hypothetical protein
MSPVGFETATLAKERPYSHTLHRAATGLELAYKLQSLNVDSYLQNKYIYFKTTGPCIVIYAHA